MLAQTDINAALELCHSGNEPSAGEWQDDVETLRSAGKRSTACIAVVEVVFDLRLDPGSRIPFEYRIFNVVEAMESICQHDRVLRSTLM